ncbi:MAG: nuclear transport factor 2 family protein [Terracidiphilus sp.]
MPRFFRYGIATLSVLMLFICAGAFTNTSFGLVAATSDQANSELSPTGFPLDKPVMTPVALPMRTRDQLVTHGNADDKAEIAALFNTYMLYHDTHNGEGVASLFVPNGALEHLWNNGGKTVEPNAGPNGLGCFSPGHDEIVEMFERNTGGQPLAFSGHSHNQVTNVSVQVYGNTATLYGNFTTIRSNDSKGDPVAMPPNSASVSHNGEDVADLRRTPEGWRFVHLRVLEDEKMKFGTASCEARYKH